VKYLKHSIYWFMLILLGLVIIFFLLTNTNAGSRWLIHQVINVSGQEVTIVGVEGSLAKKIRSEKIT